MISEKLAEPIKRGRAKIIGCLPPTIEEWIHFMDSHREKWDVRTAAYLKKVPEDFFAPESEAEEGEPCPRSWDRLAVEMAYIDDPDVLEPTIVGWLGSAVGGRFIAFLRSPIPDAEDLIKEPRLFRDLDLDGKYLASVIVASAYNREKKITLNQVYPFVKTIAEEQADFLILFMVALKKAKRTAVFREAVSRRDQVHRALAEVGKYIANL